MANFLNVFPDDELIVIRYLRSVSALVPALLPSTNVLTELPPRPAYPYVLVQRVGGQSPDSRALDEPAIQIDVLALDRGQAKRIMLTVRASILAIANDIVTGAVLVSSYEEVGPAWLPDTIPVPPLPRYVARFRVLIHNF